MAKVLQISDTHIYQHKKLPRRQNDCLATLEWGIAKARLFGIKNLIHLGDVLHDKVRIHILAYDQVFHLFESAPDIHFTIILGNHDMWYLDRRDVSSIRPFGALPNVTIVSQPTTIEIEGVPLDFAPYSRDPVSMLASFNKKSRVLFGHLAVDGAFLNIVKNTRAEVEIESDADMIPVTSRFFKGWERVFLGHYHGAQIIDGFIEYVGSACQLTWNEVNQEKHLVVLDLDTLKTEYIINDFSPRHLLLTEEQVKNTDLTSAFVCVQVDRLEKSDLVSLKAELLSKYNEKTTPIELEFIEKSKPQEETATKEEQVRFNEASGTELRRYVESKGYDNLDLELLLSVGERIIAGEI